MSIWLKIGIEIVLGLLVTFFGYGFWIFLRLPFLFDSMLCHDEGVERSLGLVNKSDKLAETKLMEELMSLDSTGFADRAKYQILLLSCYFDVLAVWSKEKWALLIVLSMIVAGSFVLYWPFALVNLSIFALLKFASDLPPAIKDAATQVSLTAAVVERWRKVDPRGCKKFCEEAPQFTAVYRVLSKSGRDSSNLIELGREKWQRTSAR